LGPQAVPAIRTLVILCMLSQQSCCCACLMQLPLQDGWPVTLDTSSRPEMAGYTAHSLRFHQQSQHHCPQTCQWLQVLRHMWGTQLFWFGWQGLTRLEVAGARWFVFARKGWIQLLWRTAAAVGYSNHGTGKHELQYLCVMSHPTIALWKSWYLLNEPPSDERQRTQAQEKGCIVCGPTHALSNDSPRSA